MVATASTFLRITDNCRPRGGRRPKGNTSCEVICDDTAMAIALLLVEFFKPFKLIQL